MTNILKSYQEENDELITNILKNRFLKAYKGDKFPGSENLSGLELIIDQKCNLACKYCYYDKYGVEYFPKGTEVKSTLLSNAKIIVKWLIDNKLFPNVTLFSGDILYRDIGIELIEIFYEFIELGGKLMIPTNASFISDDKQFKKICNILDKYPIGISLSIEGKCCEHSRPYKGKQIENRDDAYYDRVFKFAKKYGYGFHPMIHSSNIKDWKKNIDWYFDMFDKYDIAPYRLYLLEVRNEDWSNQELIIYSEFMEYLINTTFKRICNSDKNEMINYIFKLKGFNTLSSPFFRIGRGIGCSIQSMIALRLGDMTIVPCHRLAYKWFEIGKLKLPEFKVYDTKKPELMIGIYSSTTTNFPKCDNCAINSLCSSGCLGHNFETSKDLFYTNFNVCRLMHVKLKAQLESFKKIDILNDILMRLDNEKTTQIIEFCKIHNI